MYKQTQREKRILFSNCGYLSNISTKIFLASQFHRVQISHRFLLAQEHNETPSERNFSILWRAVVGMLSSTYLASSFALLLLVLPIRSSQIKALIEITIVTIKKSVTIYI